MSRYPVGVKSDKTNHYKKYYTVSFRDFYNDYKKDCKRRGEYEVRTIHQYREFIYDIFDELFNKMIYSKFHLTLPYRMGDLFLKKVKLSGMAAKIHKNLNTLGKAFRMTWDITYADFETKGFYKCTINGKYKKRLRKFYKDEVGSGSARIPEPYNYPLKQIIDFD